MKTSIRSRIIAPRAGIASPRRRTCCASSTPGHGRARSSSSSHEAVRASCDELEERARPCPGVELAQQVLRRGEAIPARGPMVRERLEVFLYRAACRLDALGVCGLGAPGACRRGGHAAEPEPGFVRINIKGSAYAGNILVEALGELVGGEARAGRELRHAHRANELVGPQHRLAV